MRAMKYLTFIFLFSSALAHGSSAIGSYNSGRLLNGVELPSEGAGFMRLFLEHNHGWGTLEMINTLVQTGMTMSELYPGRGRMQVEDISGEYGGRIEGHGSHQNGLDADITYFRVDGVEHDPMFGQKYGVSMVVGETISPLFDSQRNWDVVKALHQHGKVQRIFMDQVIKNELCRYARSINDFNVEILRSIRHVDNHQDHMHVRLRCPEDDKQCRSQAEVPGGSGCPRE